MSLLNIDGISLSYEKQGRSGRAVMLLHGWGQNMEMMAFISDFLKSHFVVYNFDLPGFGQSSEPPVPWDTDDYADLLYKFAVKKKIEEPIIIAHSFGCRVALRYALKHPVHKMVLTGAAGVRDRRGLSYYVKVYSYKLAKKILSLKPFEKFRKDLEKNAGSEDYRNTSGVMRQTFVKVVNEDITPLLKDIDVETLLVFGEKDEATPLYKGRIMEEKMPNATLVIFENDDHYAYINEARRFDLVLDAFLRSDYDR
ncbi:MAG: alpha/beta hydrolase [Erysipelotrichaceae bacterium]|nr:alpha/beta hydrolase [Erysipelotrichaceae bacterium]